MSNQHIKNIVNRTDTRTAPRYSIEEVYHRHSGVFVNDMYEFSYPQNFINSPTENRSIGLRNVHCTPPSILLHFYIVVETEYAELIHLNIPSYYTLEETLYHLKEEIKAKTGNTFIMTYNPRTNELNIKEDDNKEFIIVNSAGLNMESDIYSFQMLFNQNPESINLPYILYTDDVESKRVTSIKLYNVWNRKHLFFHSTFVTNTRFNYLASSVKNLATSMKVYQFSDRSLNFYVWASFDGCNKVALYQPFILELSFILSDKNAINIDG